MLLTFSDVYTKYGQIPMLQGVSMNIDTGEAVCVLGSNGAGKSTLLKTIIGIVKPYNGKITYNGADITQSPPHKVIEKGISIVPEREGLFPRLSVNDNLRLGAYNENDKHVLAERKEEVLDIFPRLRERLSQHAGTLSGGERKMLGIARSLLSAPKLLLMDEPSLGLAPALVNEVYDVIKKIKGEGKISLLLIEQNAQKALEVVDRGYIIQKGQIVSSGSRDELREDEMVKNSYLVSR
ncbi:MAG: ABC transporter ATP-binding protein [Spirochaetaceae bacterium]